MKIYDSEFDVWGDPERFPYVATTYRLTEHLTSGVMTRTLPYLAEAFPRHFCEIPRELAQREGIRNGDWVEVRERPRQGAGAGHGHQPAAAAAHRRPGDPS